MENYGACYQDDPAYNKKKKQFCKWYLKKYEKGAQILAKAVLSDKATFELNGVSLHVTQDNCIKVLEVTAWYGILRK